MQSISFHSLAYNLLYDMAAETLARLNPCKTNNNGYCAGQDDGSHLNNLRCCRECSNVSKVGACKVKSLACKAWICRAAAESNPEAAVELREIMEQAAILGLVAPREPKGFVMSHLGSIPAPKSWVMMDPDSSLW
jgi:hypothetical protein